MNEFSEIIKKELEKLKLDEAIKLLRGTLILIGLLHLDEDVKYAVKFLIKIASKIKNED